MAKYKVDPKNARIHPERNREAVEKSLRELKAGRSILVDREGVVIDGNLVYEKAVELGLETRVVHTTGDRLVVVVRDDLATDDPRRKALALADNQIALLAEWDEVRLEEILGELEEIDLDVMGFEEPDEPIREPTEPGELIDRAEELQKKWKVKRGQIFEISSRTVPGKSHWIMCGDSTDAGNVALLMRNEKAKMMFTDPPYGVAYQNDMDTREAVARHRRTDGAIIAGDKQTTEELVSFLTAVFSILPLIDGGAFYICAPSGDSYLSFLMVFGRQDYHYQHELIIYGWMNGAAHYFVDDRTQTSVWQIDRPRVSAEHPTMKPVELPLKAIVNSSKLGETIFDPFLGSGTTVIAAEQEGRICYGMEIEPKYIAVTLERLSALGLKPVICDG